MGESKAKILSRKKEGQQEGGERKREGGIGVRREGGGGKEGGKQCFIKRRHKKCLRHMQYE